MMRARVPKSTTKATVKRISRVELTSAQAKRMMVELLQKKLTILFGPQNGYLAIIMRSTVMIAAENHIKLQLNRVNLMVTVDEYLSG